MTLQGSSAGTRDVGIGQRRGRTVEIDAIADPETRLEGRAAVLSEM
jgi:hypothetical protein